MYSHRNSRRMTIDPLEMLDERIVPSGLGLSPAKIASQEALVTSKGGAALGAVYQDYVSYEQSGGKGTFRSSESGLVALKNKSVEIDFQEGGGNFNAVVKQLKGLGMQVTSSSASTGLIEGYLPISDLPTVAANGHDVGLAPILSPGVVPVTTPVLLASTPSATVSTPAVTISLPSVTVSTPPVTVSTPTVTSSPSPVTVSTPTATPVAASAQTNDDASLEAIVAEKAGTLLGAVYEQYLAYEEAGAQGTFTPTAASEIYSSGTSVGVDVRFSGDLNTFVAQMQELGMDVTATSATSGVVEGYLPIGQLPAVAVDAAELSLSPMYRPVIE